LDSDLNAGLSAMDSISTNQVYKKCFELKFVILYCEVLYFPTRSNAAAACIRHRV